MFQVVKLIKLKGLINSQQKHKLFLKISNSIILNMFPKKCTLELWIEIFSNINATLKK